MAAKPGWEATPNSPATHSVVLDTRDIQHDLHDGRLHMEVPMRPLPEFPAGPFEDWAESEAEYRAIEAAIIEAVAKETTARWLAGRMR